MDRDCDRGCHDRDCDRNSDAGPDYCTACDTIEYNNGSPDGQQYSYHRPNSHENEASPLLVLTVIGSGLFLYEMAKYEGAHLAYSAALAGEKIVDYWQLLQALF